MEVVGAGHEPVFARNKANTANRDFCNFKCLDKSSGFVIVDVDRAVVQTGEDPWLRRVEVDGLDTV